MSADVERYRTQMERAKAADARARQRLIEAQANLRRAEQEAEDARWAAEKAKFDFWQAKRGNIQLADGSWLSGAWAEEHPEEAEKAIELRGGRR
jgi:hypothetical protein